MMNNVIGFLNFDKVFAEMKATNGWNYNILPYLIQIERYATQEQLGETALWLIAQPESIFDTTKEAFCRYITDPKVKQKVLAAVRTLEDKQLADRLKGILNQRAKSIPSWMPQRGGR